MAQTEAAKKASEFYETLKIEGEDRIVIKFPERIIELNELLSKPVFRIVKRDFKFTLDISTRKNELDVNNGEGKIIEQMIMVPCNKNIAEIIRLLKPNIKQLVEDTSALKIWVSLLIPKIEDGNNFGVSVQEETLAEIQQVEADSTNYLEQVSRYYAARGKLVTKVVKYPFVEDYQRAIEELDERQYLSMSLTLQEIRNRYLTLHDVVIKNIEKIKKPRSSNTENLY